MVLRDGKDSAALGSSQASNIVLDCCVAEGAGWPPRAPQQRRQEPYVYRCIYCSALNWSSGSPSSRRMSFWMPFYGAEAAKRASSRLGHKIWTLTGPLRPQTAAGR